MSDPTNGIVWSLKRFFDPPAEVEREARERAQDLDGDKDRDADPPIFRCRVCDYASTDGGYCPECLADSMVRVVPVREPGPTPAR